MWQDNLPGARVFSIRFDKRLAQSFNYPAACGPLNAARLSLQERDNSVGARDTINCLYPKRHRNRHDACGKQRAAFSRRQAAA